MEREVHARWLTAAALAMAVLLIYWPVADFDFVGFDDELMITGNDMVREGLSPEAVQWALGLSYKQGTYWHPLTWLSHMLDCQLFALEPGPHHLHNLLLHAANTVALFLLLAAMSRAHWPSALVAALFALHPMNVEAVAWVASRKTLLSTLLMLLCLGLWTAYCRRPRWSSYGGALLLYAAGLGAKPMLVSLPLLLILLDLWPLARLQVGERAALPRLVLEKLPFLGLAGLSVLVSTSAAAQVSSMVPFAAVPPGLRLANALVSIPAYLGKFLAPHDLSVFYPFPEAIPPWQVAGAVLLVTALSAAALWKRRQLPWLLVGWFWFLLSYAPVSGLVQTGLWPRLADRWAYTPFIGLFIILAWGLAVLAQRLQVRRSLLAAAAAILLLVYGIISAAQVQHWRSDHSLWSHALAVDGNNAVALSGLGRSMLAEGRLAEAEALFERALKLAPSLAVAHDGAGLVAISRGHLGAAEEHLRAAMAIDPTRSATLNLATLLSQSGRSAEAITVLQQSLAVRPATAELHNIWGVALARAGRLAAAQEHFERALALEPDNAAAQANLESCRRQRAGAAD